MFIGAKGIHKSDCNRSVLFRKRLSDKTIAILVGLKQSILESALSIMLEDDAINELGSATFFKLVIASYLKWSFDR